MKTGSVLDFLRDGCEDFMSGEEISKRLGVSRTAVWKEIQGLRLLGYEIESRPHGGYRLSAVPDKLFADEISHRLGTKILGNRILSYEELDSTNDTALKLGEEGIAEGACVFAEHQKKGRGRLGRTWNAPRGKNILFSVLLRPLLSPNDVPKLTLTAAVSVIGALREATGLQCGIKWPNDIFFSDKKICGILTEMSAEADRVKFVVLGIGINVNASPKELPPGGQSLKEILGKPISRVELARHLLKKLDEDYARFQKNGFEEIARDWERFSVTSGRRVTARVLGREVHGQAVGIDADGALWIRKDNGIQERVLTGDLEHLR